MGYLKMLPHDYVQENSDSFPCEAFLSYNVEAMFIKCLHSKKLLLLQKFLVASLNSVIKLTT